MMATTILHNAAIVFGVFVVPLLIGGGLVWFLHRLIGRMIDRHHFTPPR